MFLARLEKLITVTSEGFAGYLDPFTKYKLINAPPINDYVKNLTPDLLAKKRQKKYLLSRDDRLKDFDDPDLAQDSFEVNLELVEPTKNLTSPKNVNVSYPQEAFWWQKAIAKTFTRSDLASECHAMLKKYFHELGSFPVPKIEIVNNPSSPWLGRCIYNSKNKSNTTIKIQKAILGDEKTMQRILAHELVHHVDFLTNWADKNLKFYSRDGHGEFFRKWAAKINAIEGADFVTEKSDESFILSLDKEFYILIYKNDNNQFVYQWSFRPSSKQKKFIDFVIEKKDARLTKTKDIKWTHGRKIGDRSLSRPMGELQERLKDLYDHAPKDAKI